MVGALFFAGPPLGSLSHSVLHGRRVSSITSRSFQKKRALKIVGARIPVVSLDSMTHHRTGVEEVRQTAQRESATVSTRRRDMKVRVHGLVAKRAEQVVEGKDAGNGSGSDGTASSLRPKAYWESMGVIPWFAMFGVFILVIKLLRVAFGGQEKEQSEGPRRSMAAVTTEEEQAQLHEYKCGGCGYVMYPALGREFKFFPESFRCPLCQSPKSEFWDLRDPDDPRNQEEEEEEENKEVVDDGAEGITSGSATEDAESPSSSVESVEGNGDASAGDDISSPSGVEEGTGEATNPRE